LIIVELLEIFRQHFNLRWNFRCCVNILSEISVNSVLLVVLLRISQS